MKRPAHKRDATAAPLKANAATRALTLSQIQDRLQAAILSGDDAVLDHLLDNSRTSRRTLFGVYRDAYVGRLVEILQNEYEILHSYCGDDIFGELARAYIAAFPSRSQNARWVGSRMPDYLRASSFHDAHPELADIAAIEKAVSNAFDAADAAILDFNALSKFSPDQWGGLSFASHPSVSRLELSTNAFAIWKAVKDQQPPPPCTAAHSDHVVIWRQNTAPMVRLMGEEEVMMWSEASRGVRFDVLCEMLATYDDPENAAGRAAGYLQGWLTTHMLTSASLTKKNQRPTPSDRAKGATARSASKRKSGAE